MLDAAKAKVNEAADRTREAGHHIAHAVTGDTHHEAEALQDRGKAELHNRQADAHFQKGKRGARDGDGH
ncbi:hypothetical protein GCM10008955_05100 [Deinococcus malanensis]|uniref:CsbD family protein n=1 Tax=Deinococcus malanensis TaxID=1706855 RepID=A0ABQ2EMJ8_9DEIO|nr:hypothetical protein [Deinococcus malanensis]GGK14632.1 hypothetical protein GCM10008955_05100 [Deinococcus malanensis]